MNLLTTARHRLAGRSPHRGVAAFILGILFSVIPAFSLAGEGNVKLEFSSTDKNYLYVSLVLGLVAIVTAWILRVTTMRRDPGSDKMQAVSQAIKEGALAYLKKQISTMLIFVVLLAIGLFFLYKDTYSPGLAVAIAGCFIGGVAASYIAGWVGMMMAVNGNTRTAAAALTSYKKSLETAFQSGAVAGMVTVGMGLIGATLIFLFAGSEAMKLLVGFGFGGSLAALFMRVGGGIFTKAADVGADLVGKVEAGIPEDDPRNPATIADNVGDNVGDCAGMAADIFESYEVTLVAAIILGAATAAIFDQATWMKLILFALMARGAGIVASIIGIVAVRGNDNVDTDPLKPISRGFQVSALAAAIATVALAYFMMQGISTSTIQSITALNHDQAVKVQKLRDDLTKQAVKDQKAKEGDKAGEEEPEVSAEAVADAAGPILGLTSNSDAVKRVRDALVRQYLAQDIDSEPKSYVGYRKIDLEAKDSLGEKFAVSATQPTAGKPYVTLSEEYGGKKAVFYKIDVPMAQDGKDRVQMVTGPYILDKDGKNPEFESTIKMMEAQNQTVTKVAEYEVAFYANDKGDLAIGFDGKVENPWALQVKPITYYAATPSEVMDAMAGRTKAASMPQSKTIGPSMASPGPANVLVANPRPVDWWRFPLCIVFGIAMAFLIERLTDYYVSLHKKPVQEVAGTSTTGPATMIITGFAYGMESSVFSVFAIVVALIAPMLIFPPAEFGGYILSFYGIALVGLGLLTTTGFILAMDTFGPISDNAQGVYEMSGEGHDNEVAAKAVQRLDAAGNTTKALTKGFAIATAVVAAVALYHSYLEDAGLTKIGLRLEIPEIFLGLLIGGAAPYLFSAFSINAVGRAAFKLINEVRRQFREDAGIMAGTSKPDYGRCVAIVTKAAQQELLGPGIIAIALPAAVAFGFSIGKPTVGGLNLTGAQALGGYLAGAILSGQLMAVMLANSGGIWDNAKKFIEDGAYGGKGSEAHKAGVVCDTVGDPFKDTAGPALNPLIKVMNLVALLLAPVIILPFSNLTLIVVTSICVAALAFSVFWSKRASLSSELSAAEPKALDGSSEAVPPTQKRITVEDDEKQ